MKPFYLLSLILLVSCSNNPPPVNEEETNVVTEHDYEEVTKWHISWENIFEQEQDYYYCYIYSKTCSYCQNIKNIVIDYALKHENLYFVEYTKIIPILDDVDKTIGVTTIEDVGILGTPSLLTIFNKTLIENTGGSKKVLAKLENQ